MKKLIFGLIATVMLSFTVNAQDKFIEDKTEIVGSSTTTTNNAKLPCRKYTITVHLLAFDISTDVYISCDFPAGLGIGGGTCLIVNEDYCNIGSKKIAPTKYLNVNNLKPDIDVSKVTYVEVTKSSTFLDVDGLNYSIVLGKYAVDSSGNFEIKEISTK